MAITFTYQATPLIASGADASSYTGSSVTWPSNELVILAITSTNTAAPPPNQPTVTGNGITWTAIASATVTTLVTRVTLLGAYTAGASAGAVTVDFGGQTQRDCQAVFLTASGTDVANGVAQTFVQAPTNTAVLAGSLSITLSAAANAANRPVAAFAETFDTSSTPRTNWTEYYDNAIDEVFDCQYRSDAFDTTASSTAASGTGTWVGIAAEIKAAATFTASPMMHMLQMTGGIV